MRATKFALRAPSPKEHEIQRPIVQAIHLAGFRVLETTAYRQKGSSGVDLGIPDLLVYHPDLPGVFFGIEVKRDHKSHVRPEQQALVDLGIYGIATTPEEALHWLQKQVSNHCLADRDVTGRLSRTLASLRGGTH